MHCFIQYRCIDGLHSCFFQRSENLTGDGAGGYESEADLEAELARQREEMERTMARLESKRRGY